MAISKFTLIASRAAEQETIGFTVATFFEPAPDEDKLGRYVYLTINDSVLVATIPETEFAVGTSVKHFGYDLSSYPSPVGPNSVYGLLNRILFDPVLPVWLDNPVNNQRRVIKGARNALNGAVDEGDEDRRGVRLSHHVPLFFSSLSEFGRLGIEYWVLERPTEKNKRPTAAFVNPGKPIVLTLNGQNQAELSQILVRKEAELPFLAQRTIVHVDCNSLTPGAKRSLFVSNREDARRGLVLRLITDEVVRALRSDDDLVRLNNEAREQGMRERDESAVQQMRQEVSRLLRLQGLNVGASVGGEAGSDDGQDQRPTHPRRPRRPPEPIELHEPPTHLNIVWGEDKEVTFYPEQRRFIRIQTDAHSSYHDPDNPDNSRINIIVSGSEVAKRGSTPLKGGRMRAIFEAPSGAGVGGVGGIRIEMTRPGLPLLSDERSVQIVEAPPVRPGARQVTLPPWDIQPVQGPTDPKWAELGWPDYVDSVASSAEMEEGTLVVYYSTAFPKYANSRGTLERRDPTLASSFTARYEIWLTVHSLLLHQDQQSTSEALTQQRAEEDPELAEAREREERCRLATLSALFATREVQQPAGVDATLRN